MLYNSRNIRIAQTIYWGGIQTALIQFTPDCEETNISYTITYFATIIYNFEYITYLLITYLIDNFYSYLFHCIYLEYNLPILQLTYLGNMNNYHRLI